MCFPRFLEVERTRWFCMIQTESSSSNTFQSGAMVNGEKTAWCASLGHSRLRMGLQGISKSYAKTTRHHAKPLAEDLATAVPGAQVARRKVDGQEVVRHTQTSVTSGGRRYSAGGGTARSSVVWSLRTPRLPPRSRGLVHALKEVVVGLLGHAAPLTPPWHPLAVSRQSGVSTCRGSRCGPSVYHLSPEGVLLHHVCDALLP